MAIWLRSVALAEVDDARASRFPYSVPVVRALAGTKLDFESPVTIFVGENGSGKSTLLEAIAVAAKSITVGTSQATADESLRAAQRLARDMKLVWNRNLHRGFYMRAEDFFGYAKNMQQIREDARADIAALYADRTISDRQRGFALQAYTSQLSELEADYGEGLDTRSHGEAFLALFQARLVPNGLYLLDEPEAPLSPRRQIALLAMMKDAVEQTNGQFIIATHSPILMAYPGAAILTFDEGAICSVAYDEIDHVVITRDFLAHRELFLKHL